MKNSNNRITKILAVLALGGTLMNACFAGKTLKWEEVPEPVQKTILANGGKLKQEDKEKEKIGGLTVYEAEVKNKKGKIEDLVITEDGKLVEVKHDGEADLIQEQVARAKKLLEGAKFSHPRDITNPYFPMSSLKQDVLEGTEDGKKMRIERTALLDKHRTFKIAGQEVDAFVIEDRSFKDGELEEVALDYFVQDDAGTVYYLGEEVDNYEGGKLKDHEGSWMLGRDSEVPGVIFPAKPKVGDKFMPEDVSDEIREKDEILSVTETVVTPAGTFKDCIKIKELLADGEVEHKYYAPGVGVVREVPADGEVLLISHTVRTTK